MKIQHTASTLALLSAMALLGTTLPVSAQVAGGTTTVGVSVTESTELAMGWSVKKTLMGKTIYNEAGAKVGKIEDLIVAPDKNVSYVIVGAGGFVGIGRHDVAVPVTQIVSAKDGTGRLVMAGATKESIKALPEFAYAPDTSQRDAFVAAADKDIAKGKAKVADLEKRAGTAAADAKTRIDVQVAALNVDVKAAEAKLGEMKQATAARWKEFQGSVNAATAKLRKSVDTATG